jgi:hypothetical protein
MNAVKVTCIAIFFLVFSVSSILASSVSMRISGPGTINDSTIKAGEKVSVDIYVANDSVFKGYSLGFTVKSPTIKTIVHVADSGNGLNDYGDIKGYNGWDDLSIWDFGGVFVVERDWDGELPEILGFGGLCIKKNYEPHDLAKVLSFEMIVPDTGEITVDSSFFSPGGIWMFSAPPPARAEEPDWLGPYTFKVVK